MIDYQTVLGAVKGEPEAARTVLEEYEVYIDRLSTHAFVDGCGRVEYGVDTSMKSQLQGKLLLAMLHFTV